MAFGSNMRGSRAVAGGVALLAVLAGCGAGGSPADLGAGTPSRTPQVTSSAPAPAGGLPSGWRWESYGGIEVGVPGSWGYGTSDTPWCVSVSSGSGHHEPPPYVGRPGPSELIGCAPGKSGTAHPEARVATAGTFIWFGASRYQPAGTLGDRQTVVLGGASLAVQAPRALRRQILATVRHDRVDHDGCPVGRPFGQDRGWRPAPGVGVDRLTGVSAVAACRYTFTGGLVGSVGLAGPAAVRAVQAVAAAPLGGGPNAPADCAPDYEYGDELIVLQVDSSQGRHQIALRYDGCDHHGFDDGSTVRTLTRAAVAPFVSGPNRLTSWSGVLNGVLSP